MCVYHHNNRCVEKKQSNPNGSVPSEMLRAVMRRGLLMDYYYKEPTDFWTFDDFVAAVALFFQADALDKHLNKQHLIDKAVVVYNLLGHPTRASRLVRNHLSYEFIVVLPPTVACTVDLNQIVKGLHTYPKIFPHGLFSIRVPLWETHTFVCNLVGYPS